MIGVYRSNANQKGTSTIPIGERESYLNSKERLNDFKNICVKAKTCLDEITSKFNADTPQWAEHRDITANALAYLEDQSQSDDQKAVYQEKADALYNECMESNRGPTLQIAMRRLDQLDPKDPKYAQYVSALPKIFDSGWVVKTHMHEIDDNHRNTNYWIDKAQKCAGTHPGLLRKALMRLDSEVEEDLDLYDARLEDKRTDLLGDSFRNIAAGRLASIARMLDDPALKAKVENRANYIKQRTWDGHKEYGTPLHKTLGTLVSKRNSAEMDAWELARKQEITGFSAEELKIESFENSASEAQASTFYREYTNKQDEVYGRGYDNENKYLETQSNARKAIAARPLTNTQKAWAKVAPLIVMPKISVTQAQKGMAQPAQVM